MPIPDPGGGSSSGGGPQVSAVPQDLMSYSKQGVAHAQTLMGTGRRLESDLDAFVASGPDPTIMKRPVPYLGSQLQRYATVKQTNDGWVGKVGLAFEEAGVAQWGSDFFNYPGMAVSTTADQIDSLVTRDDQAPGQGKSLADQINQAINDGDLDRVKRLLAQLYARQDDPLYTAAFFKELGPANTLLLVGTIRDDQGQLYSFDTALANATNAPNWDPAFTRRLFDPRHPALRDFPNSTVWDLAGRLFAYGTFSSDFLGAGGDFFFESAYTDANAAANYLGALSRNPSFAAQWLTARLPDGTPRIDALLQNTTLMFLDTRIGQNLGAALIAADLQPGDSQALQLLQDLARVDPALVPNSMREAVTFLVTSNVDDFTSASRLSVDDQKTLFAIAELDFNGQPDAVRVGELQAAIVAWAQNANHWGPGNRPTEADLQSWFEKTGNLFADWAAPQVSADYDENARRHLQSEFYDVLGIVVIGSVLAVPGVGEALGPVAIAAIGGGVAVVGAKVQDAVDEHNLTALQGQLLKLYQQADGQARTTMLYQSIAVDPTVIPKQVVQMGTGAVNDYLSQLGSATGADQVANIKIDGQRIFTGLDDPAARSAIALQGRMDDMDSQILRDFTAWAHSG